MADNKMYSIDRPIKLPDNIQVSDSMYKTKCYFDIPDNLRETYYQGSLPNKKTCHSTNLKNDTVMNGKVPGDGELSMEGLKERQESILEKLKGIKEKLNNLKGSQMTFVSGSVQVLSNDNALKSGVIHDIVISSSPSNPPFFLLPIRKMLGSQLRILSSCSVHSSVNCVDLTTLRLFRDETPKERAEYDVAFTVLWKDQNTQSLMVNPLTQNAIIGEANILRYLARLFPSISCLSYESKGSVTNVSETDFWMDSIQTKFLHGSNNERASLLEHINSKLGTSKFLYGDSLGLSDVFCWSSFLQLKLTEGLPSNVENWLKRISQEIGINIGDVSSTDLADGGSNESHGFVARKCLEDMLTTNGIKFQVRDHKEVFTVDALMECVGDMPGLHMKNLFLKDKKKDLYLLCARHDAQIRLNTISKLIDAKELRFGDEQLLLETLGVVKGCVTLFALLNDSTHKVTLLLDSEANNSVHPFVNFHPMTNAATLGISPSDLTKFLKLTGHKVHIIEI